MSERRVTYLSLMGLFLSLFGIFAAVGRRRSHPPVERPFDLALLGLAAFRTARLLSLDQVAEPLRAPVTELRDGDTEPKGRGFQRALGQLVSCPTCVGTWIAAGLTYGLIIVPRVTRIFLTIQAAAGLVEGLNYVMSALDAIKNVASNRAEQVERQIS